MLRQYFLSATSCSLFILFAGLFLVIMVQAFSAPKPDRFYSQPSQTTFVGSFNGS